MCLFQHASLLLANRHSLATTVRARDARQRRRNPDCGRTFYHSNHPVPAPGARRHGRRFGIPVRTYNDRDGLLHGAPASASTDATCTAALEYRYPAGDWSDARTVRSRDSVKIFKQSLLLVGCELEDLYTMPTELKRCYPGWPCGCMLIRIPDYHFVIVLHPERFT